MIPRILIIDDEEEMCWALSRAMRQEGYLVTTATKGRRGLEILAEEGASLVLLDLKMPDIDGLEVLRKIMETDPDLPVIMITGHGTLEVAIEALANGAIGYVAKPFDLHQLKITVQRALQLNRLKEEVGYLRSELTKDHQGIIGETPAMVKIRDLITRVAPTDATVLVTGESGTGKEVVAVAIHRLSQRASGPFVTVNCAAIPEQLLESELFGHEKGAFTGATSSRIGRFELADNGTIFLDEIAEMSPTMQAKLLRVLQEHTFERLGGATPVHVNIRVVAATNKDLEKAVKEGKFREDLFYRLNVIRIHLPPLRERREDIPLLAAHFLEKFCPANRGCRISEEAMELLLAYDWPGNVRELQNVLERAVILSTDGVIGPDHLPHEFHPAGGLLRNKLVPASLPEGSTLKNMEAELIARALAECGGNRSRAAKKLGIARTTLLFKMQKYGLK
ncbi:MAG: sigma-54 dependent transcriptional regulator [Thermoanaerobacterales bacterium]|nr:sigma-54 dependent transcriptional regulator [Bacillota bacterium]MDI6906691.1 sigma-54 dependent transcriptional regulator [Thermoanaerobacterales bacterium]